MQLRARQTTREHSLAQQNQFGLLLWGTLGRRHGYRFATSGWGLGGTRRIRYKRESTDEALNAR